MAVIGFSSTLASPSGSAAGARLVDGADGAAEVPLRLLTLGTYARDGADLVITGPDGEAVVVRDYFVGEPPTLTAPGGAALDADTVRALAGEPATVAEADGATAQQIAQAATAIGSVSKLDGIVTVQRADGSVVELRPGDPVYQGDVVTTADGSSLGLTFIDGTQFSLGGGGRMVLDELVYNPESGEGEAGFSLLAGSFSFVSGAISKSGTEAMQVKTPVATIGIRGTSGSISVGTSEDAELKVVLIPDPDGTVGEIQILTTTGESFSINVPMGAFRIANGQPQTFTMTRQEFTREFGRALDGLDQRDALEERVREVAPRDEGQDGAGDRDGADQPTGEDEEGDAGQDDRRSDARDDDDTDDTAQGDGEDGEGGDGVIKVVSRDDDSFFETIYRDPLLGADDDDDDGDRIGGDDRDDDSQKADKGGADDGDDDRDLQTGDTDDDDGGQDDSVAQVSIDGRIVDPYVKNATVWLDYDGDGVLDDDEPWTTSDEEGRFSLDGDQRGRLMSSGGQDTASNATVGTFMAPMGAQVVTPLTTLMQSMIESGAAANGAQAQQKLATALGLDLGGTTLTSFDPYGAVKGGAATDSAAAKILTAGVLVQNVISVVAGALAGTGLDPAAADKAAFQALADLSNGQTGTDFLKDSAQLTTLVDQAAAAGGKTLSASAASGLANVIGSLASAVEASAAASGDPTALVANLAALARVAQVEGKASAKSFVEAGGADGSFVDRFQGDNLQTLVEDAQQDLGPLVPVLIGSDASDVLAGTEANDTIYGHGGADILTGRAGADTLIGGTGDDALDGGAGHDRLEGGAGADALTGGAGNDHLDGGAGVDTAYYTGAAGAVTVNLAAGTATGGAGADTLESIENVVGSAHDDLLIGTAGANVLNGGGGIDTVSYAGAATGVTVDLAAGTASGGGGADTLISIESVIGSAHGDVLKGGAGVTVLDGGAGDDVLVTDGDDVLKGGAGHDRVELSGSHDWSGTTTVTGIEALHLTDGSLTLDAAAVLAMGGTVDVTLGAGASLVDSGAGWALSGTEVVDGVTVRTWRSGDATLRVSGDGDASGLNHRPVALDGGLLGSIAEDGGPFTVTLESLLAGRVSDTAGTAFGVAVTGVGGGGTWTAQVGGEGEPLPLSLFFGERRELQILDGPQLPPEGEEGPSGTPALVLGPGTVFTFHPDADWNGETGLTFHPVEWDDAFTEMPFTTIEDLGDAATAEAASAPVQVTPVNDAPTAADATVLAVSAGDGAPLVATGQVSASDIEGHALSYAVLTAAGHGTVQVAADGGFTYTAGASFPGTDSFQIVVTDALGATTTSTITVGSLAGGADIPAGVDTPVSLAIGERVGGTLEEGGTGGLTNSGAIDGDAYKVTLQAGVSYIVEMRGDYNGAIPASSPEYGGTLNDPYLYLLNASGSVLSSDDDGGLDYNARLTVTPDASGTYVLQATSYNWASNGAAAVSGTYTLSVFEGIVTSGYATFDADAGTTHADMVKLTATASVIDLTDRAFAPWTNIELIDAAGGATSTLRLDAASVAALTDAEGVLRLTLDTADTLEFQDGGWVSGGTATLDGLAYAVWQKDGATVQVSAGSAVTFANAVPVAQDLALTLLHDSTPDDDVVSGQVVASDPDGDSLTFALGDGPANGTATVNADGSFTYAPASGFAGTDSFAVTVEDSVGNTTTSTVSVTVDFMDSGADGFAQAAALHWAGLSVGAGASMVAGMANGLPTSAETFTGLDLGSAGGMSYGLSHGLLLTSGGLPGNGAPSTSLSTQASGAGDGDLNQVLQMAGQQSLTTDSTSLSFTVSTADSGINGLLFRWMFASEEFPTQNVSDVAGVFVDGHNALSMVDGSYVHYDQGGNDALFTDAATAGLSTAYNGVTAPRLQAGRFDPEALSHTVKIAVSDTSDSIIDSGLYFSSVAVTRSNGTAADDWILTEGGATLTGGAGADAFFYTDDTVFGDLIADFTGGEDSLWFDRAGLVNGGQLAEGALDASRFVQTTDAPETAVTGSGPAFVFQSGVEASALYYDADGAGEGYTCVKVADLQGGADLDNLDIRLA